MFDYDRYNYEEYLTQLADDLSPVLAANLDCGGFNLTNAGAITGTSFIIGENTLDTNEWANLDGLDQSLKREDTVRFGGLNVLGNAYVSSVAKFGDGSSTAPSITFNSDTDTGFYKYTTDSIGVACDGEYVVRITSSSLTHIGVVQGNYLFPVLGIYASDTGSATANYMVLVDNGTKALVPSSDNYFDLGSSTLEWKNLHLDGAAYIDALGQGLDCGGFGLTNAGACALGTGTTIGNLTLADGSITDSSGLITYSHSTDSAPNPHIMAAFEAAGDDDTYITFKNTSVGDSRFYLNWLNQAGNNAWLMGRNSEATSDFILYDAINGVHRFVCYDGADTRLNAVGANPVRINYYGDANTGTGGFEVYAGGANGDRWCLIDGRIYNFQKEDEGGIKTFGFDDQSTAYWHVYIDGSGNTKQVTTGSTSFQSGAEINFTTAANKDVWMNLGDNVGAEKLNVRNYSRAVVASVDSTGKGSFASAAIGDDTNNLLISSTGVVTMAGTAKVKKTRTFVFNYRNITAQGKPTLVNQGLFYGFSLPVYNNDDEELFACRCFDADWDGTSDPVIYLGGWLDTANTSKKFNLQVSVEIVDFNSNDVVPVTTNDYAVETTTGTWAQYTSFLIPFTIDASAIGLAVGQPFAVRVRRIAATADEIAGEVVIEGASLEYVANKLGGSV